MSDRPVDVLSKPLAPAEEAEVRERDSWCHGPLADGSWTVYGQSAFRTMAEHTEMAFADRRRLLATLAAARSATPSSEEDGPTGNRVWGDCRRCGTPFANCPAEPDPCCSECWHVAEATPDNAGRSPIDVEALALALCDDDDSLYYESERHDRSSCGHRTQAARLAARLSESTGSEEGR